MTKKKEPIKIRKDITYPAIVIGGCARSGTNFISKLLTQGGVPCNHEILFGAPGFGHIVDNAVAESSWLAIPYFPREKMRGAILIHLIRHPLKHISSMNHVHTFEDYQFKSNIYTIYKELFLPTIQRYRLMDRYMYNWIKWNIMAEKYADLTYRLEDLVENPKEIFDDLGIDVSKVKFDTKPTNTYNKPKQIKWEDLVDYQFYQEFVYTAWRYKYIDDKEYKRLRSLKSGKPEIKMHKIIE